MALPALAPCSQCLLFRALGFRGLLTNFVVLFSVVRACRRSLRRKAAAWFGCLSRRYELSFECCSWLVVNRLPVSDARSGTSFKILYLAVAMVVCCFVSAGKGVVCCSVAVAFPCLRITWN